MGQEYYEFCFIIAGYNEYVTIEKSIANLDVEKMELIKSRQEITRLQSEIIKELKSIDAKLDSYILQKFQLEKRKFQLLEHVELSVPILKYPNISPNNSDSKNPATQSPSTSCVIRKPVKRSPPPISNPSKVQMDLLYKDELLIMTLSKLPQTLILPLQNNKT